MDENKRETIETLAADYIAHELERAKKTLLEFADIDVDQLRKQLADAKAVQVVEITTDSGLKQRGVWHTIDNTDRLFIDVADVSKLFIELADAKAQAAAAGGLVTAANKVVDDCKAVGVIPFGLPALERAIDALQATPQPPAVDSELVAAVKPLLKVWADFKTGGSFVGEDFVDYVYLLPDFEDHFEQLAAAALKAGE